MSPIPPATRSRQRPARADALRNRARLLDAAQKAFTQRGTDASLEDIARQAGVGIGTLYRHFPSRDDLVESLIHDRALELIELSERLLDADDAVEALWTWLKAAVHHTATFRGLAESLVAAQCEQTRLGMICQQQQAAGAALLHRAQQLGDVRADVTVDDVIDLTSSISWITEHGIRDNRDHLLAVVFDGLRTHPPAI